MFSENELKNMQIDEILQRLSELDYNELNLFMKNEAEFAEKNNIFLYDVIRFKDDKRQLKFLKKIDEKTEDFYKFLMALNRTNKEKLIKEEKYKEYIKYLKLENTEVVLNDYLITSIIPDFEIDIENYRNFDNNLVINPLKIENKEKLMELCYICPNLRIINIVENDKIAVSTGLEYYNSEKKIKDILKDIKEDYSGIEKVLVVENAIGRMISYFPTYSKKNNLEFNQKNAIWKIVDSTYGTHSGICNVMKYILEKIGIKSVILEGKEHSYLKVQTEECEIIVDVSWDMMYHKYGIVPRFFGISYDEIRKYDIIDGNDRKIHENESGKNVNIMLKTDEIRQMMKKTNIYTDMGALQIQERTEEIFQNYDFSQVQRLEGQIKIIERLNREFWKSPNENMGLVLFLLEKADIKELKLIKMDICFDKKDEKKEPIMYIYAEFENGIEKRYYADKINCKFSEILKEEFENKFELYEEKV